MQIPEMVSKMRSYLLVLTMMLRQRMLMISKFIIQLVMLILGHYQHKSVNYMKILNLTSKATICWLSLSNAMFSKFLMGFTRLIV